MDVNKLSCFCLVYETKSFAQAADRSYFSRQAIGKMIRGMEAEWGVTLFRREANGVDPTEEADNVYPLAKRVVALYDQILAVTDRRQAGATKLSVAVARGVSASLPGRFFSAFTSECPDVELDLRIMDAQECEDAVSDGLCEVALAVAPVQSPHMRFVSLKREPLYLFGSFSVLDEEGSIERGTSLLLLDRNFKLDRILLEEKRSLIEGLQVKDGFDGYSMIVEMAKAGQGVCVGPGCYLQTFGDGSLFRWPIESDRYRWEIVLLVSPSAELSTAAERFVAYAMSARLD